MAKKHSNVFYILNKDGTFHPCKGAVKIPNEIGVDLFKYNREVSDGVTGLRICAIGDLDRALSDVIQSAEHMDELRKPYIKKHGLSPRYTNPEIRKEQLWPRDEANLHSETTREKTKLENQHLDTKKESSCVKSEQESKEKHQKVISEAECKILCGEKVLEVDIGNRQSLTLQLFKENGIDVPSRTKGWITSSLCSFTVIDDSQVEFSYYKSKSNTKSSSIGTYIHKLAGAVREKYMEQKNVLSEEFPIDDETEEQEFE
jgi:hypothetical protein